MHIFPDYYNILQLTSHSEKSFSTVSAKLGSGLAPIHTSVLVLSLDNIDASIDGIGLGNAAGNVCRTTAFGDIEHLQVVIGGHALQVSRPRDDRVRIGTEHTGQLQVHGFIVPIDYCCIWCRIYVLWAIYRYTR